MNKDLYDVVIIGAGPAGLSAAIYMARAKYRVLVLEKDGIGGQITITSEIVNYPGVETISGKALTERMRIQAEGFGAEFVLAEVTEMKLGDDIKIIHTTRGDYKALGVILAPGANPRKLGFDGEAEFQGRGVAYCATCDGEFFAGKEVFVIGGGFAAVEESIFLTKYASKVTIVVRGKQFSCSGTVVDSLKNYDKINVLFDTELIEAGGQGSLQYAKFRDKTDKSQWEYNAEAGETFGIFVFAGYVPNTGWIGNNVELDQQGYIITDADRRTNIEGVFAAGDVCVKNLRQVVTAVADGAIAATSLEKVVSEKHDRLGIPELYRSKSVDESRSHNEAAKATENKDRERDDVFIDNSIKDQLREVFDKFTSNVKIRAWLDNSSLSEEMQGFLDEFTDITDRVSWERAEGYDDSGIVYPAMELVDASGNSSGVFFHGIPGGHEFNSFIVALYNVAGPGQAIDDETMEHIMKIDRAVNIKVLVSLSCTMCPESVMGSQKIAAVNGNVTAEMFDLTHFPELKDKYNVMSVPCIVIDDEKVAFGKKNTKEILEMI